MFMKMTVNGGDMVNRVGLSRKHIFDAVDAIIARLGTHLDVLQIHRLHRDTPRQEIMKFFNDVMESGKARYIGACTVRLFSSFMAFEISCLICVQMAAWEFQTLKNIAKQNGWHQFISMQDYYNLLYRKNEREMIPYCRDSGVGFIPYSLLARGLLSRPYSSEQTTRQKTDPSAEFMLGKTTSADIEIIGRVEKLAEKKGVSMATITLAWCFVREVMPIAGLGTVNRVNETVKAIRLAKAGLLEKDDIDFLEEKYVAKPAMATGY